MSKTFCYLIGTLVFLLLWHLASLGIDRSIILPRPYLVLSELLRLAGMTATWQAALQTAWKVLAGLILVLAAGVSIGLFLGVNSGWRDSSRPIIMVIQAVPVISWLSLVLFTWGPGWEGPVFIVFLSLLPTAVLTTISGVQNLDRGLLEMASVYRVPYWAVFKHIYLGSLLPFFAAVIDISIGQAWKVILVAEYLAGDRGLGVNILSARYEVNAVKVYAYTLLAVILGIITERTVKALLGRISIRWKSV